MSQRNFTRHSLPALDRMCAAANRNSMRGIALVALGALCLVDEATATATYIATLPLGWLLVLLGVLTVRRNSHQPSKCLVNVTPVRPHSLRRRRF
jgi:hypothetical protein